MNFEQEKRYEKIFKEPLYLIDHQIHQEDITFLISGSTKNIYHVECKEKKMSCDCQDAKSWCRKHKVVCKHICFVLFRVSKLFRKDVNQVYFNSDPTNYFETHKLNDQEKKFLISSVNKKLVSTDVMNENLREIYFQKVQENQPKSLFSQSKKELDPSDECPICYDLLTNSESSLLSCPDCKNYVHQKCMEKWLEYNHSCVYCRSETWRKIKQEKSSIYINLA
jgi:hypothetical protein